MSEDVGNWLRERRAVEVLASTLVYGAVEKVVEEGDLFDLDDSWSEDVGDVAMDFVRLLARPLADIYEAIEVLGGEV